MTALDPSANVRRSVERAMAAQPIVDMHTHLYAPAFGHTGDDPRSAYLLWGIDELLCYHYFTDELFRCLEVASLTPGLFFDMPKHERADLVWKTLFLDRTPVSESCVGLIEVLVALGLDPREKSLDPYRKWFASQKIDQHIDRVMSIAGVSTIVMTNEVFNEGERALWLQRGDSLFDSRFRAVVRMDPLLNSPAETIQRLSEWGYETGAIGSREMLAGVRRFLDEWIARTGAIYMAASLPPTFRYPGDEGEDEYLQRLIFDECIVPAAEQARIPIALMIGVVRGVNPEMRDAGDGLDRAGTKSICELAAVHPSTRFLVTMLSREDQHDLCVAARKFRNITPFGCWWYLNTTSMIEEMTRLRFELLGTSFIPQHSDARVLEQLIYKWRHSRSVIAECLAERYTAVETAGRAISDSEVKGEINRLFAGNFANLCPALAEKEAKKHTQDAEEIR